MAAFAILLLALPVLLLAVAIGGALFEGRRSPYPFGMGRVISNAFAAIGGAPLALFAASALLNAPVTLATSFATFGVNDPERVLRMATMVGPFGLLWLFLYPFVKLFMTGIAVDTLENRAIDLPATLRMALRRTLPALGMLILFGMALMLGMVFLIVPALVLMLTWFVILPVMAAEGEGPIECFGRSSQLMRGMRWRLLLLLVIAGVLWLIVSGMVQGLAVALLGANDPWLSAAIQAIFSTLLGVFPAVGAAAVYHEVRTAKEGAGTDDFDAVFG
ncbi:hypothetical protein ASE67_08650 [Sphingomonas sp. Leaf23]|uniref:hypothetical protein n=1 Tax=Sphingomonas sp. Leaf23 TaxID=1735689 RepID=UPI0006FF85C1|nr:hypothetical protein [Sphingomonas sp. Leaf23]KQM85945.1 hypothetical protein ASE67_08650 [Sphingomonas sp. Leaf23]